MTLARSQVYSDAPFTSTDGTQRVAPPPGFVAPKVTERASSTWSEPAPGPSSAQLSAHTGLVYIARQLMSSLNQMVDIMLRGPLAPLVVEEANQLHQRFMEPPPPPSGK